jgi:hypothetical protein
MATKTGYRPPEKQGYGGHSNQPGDPVGVANDTDNDSFYIIVIIALLALIMFIMPVLMWMYMDIRQSEIKVEKLIKKLEEK